MAPQVAQSLVDETVELARRAGATTLAWFQAADLAVERKGDDTPVTEADRAAERLIREHLHSHHPDDSIVGEEEGHHRGNSSRTWYIDPIDGTRSFVHGVPLFATLIAVEDEHGVAAATIELPALGETIAAGRGLGCFWNGDRASVSNRPGLEGASLTRSEYEQIEPEVLDRLRASPLRLTTWGDAYGYALVATGRAEAMFDSIAYVWDLAPMALIIEEAGGRFTDVTGAPSFSRGSGVASNGLIHDQLLALIGGTA